MKQGLAFFCLLAIVASSAEAATVFCKRINTTDYYAPARVSDGEWLQDYGTTLDQCSQQIQKAKAGLVCSRIQQTDFYAPKTVTAKVWRGDYGTDFATCGKQTRGAKRGVLCQKIQQTDWFAPANSETGAWLQENGVSLDDCLKSLGNHTAPVGAVSGESASDQ